MTDLNIQRIDVHELNKRLATDPSLCLIDVRELEEWQALHIPSAIHIPKDRLAEEINQKIPDLNRPIYLHCKGGVRSLAAASNLCELGYKEVYSIDGGIAEWEYFGYPTS